MKKIVFLFCVFVLYLALCSCNEKPVVDIEGDCPDPIKLSKKELSFSALGGVDSVIMKDKYWWFDYYDTVGTCEFIVAEDNPDYCNDNYCKSNDIMKIECTWFSVKRTSDYKLLVSVNRNDTGETRRQRISVQAGNCFSGFFINQFAE